MGVGYLSGLILYVKNRETGSSYKGSFHIRQHVVEAKSVPGLTGIIQGAQNFSIIFSIRNPLLIMELITNLINVIPIR